MFIILTYIHVLSVITFKCLFNGVVLCCPDVSSSDGSMKACSTLSLANGVSLQSNSSGGFQRRRLQAPTLAELDSSDSDVSVCVCSIISDHIQHLWVLHQCVLLIRMRPWVKGQPAVPASPHLWSMTRLQNPSWGRKVRNLITVKSSGQY